VHLLTDGSAAALDRDVILDTVFSYVGIKHYIYVAGVSRRWRARYLKLCYCKAAANDNADKLCTSFENAAKTAATLQVAFDSGLTVAGLHKNQQASARALAATSLEPIAVLTLARVYGLQWTTDYTRNAAFKNNLPLLQWLLRCGCPCAVTSVARVARVAIYNSNLEMLKHCHTAVAQLPASMREELLWEAGKRGRLSILQWLHEVGTAWPATFYSESNNCWTVPAVQWALANGCTWGSWKCQAKPSRYYCAFNGRTIAEHNDAECTAAWCCKRQAAALFAWAHGHGCLCTSDEP
jgi:hypothetical protein